MQPRGQYHAAGYTDLGQSTHDLSFTCRGAAFHINKTYAQAHIEKQRLKEDHNAHEPLKVLM